MIGFFKRHRDRWFLLACLALSGGLQLSFISRSSIWHDEGYSLLLAPQSLSDILIRTARDVHPPLYYLVLHFWLKLFGTSELAARSLSMICILLAVVVMFALIKRLLGAGAARVSVLFMAVAPFLIRYGQEARMYGPVALLIALATYLLVSAMDDRSRWRLYLYAVVMAAALYTHYYAVFMLPVHWLYVLIRTQRRSKRRKGSLDLKSPHWWAANGLLATLFGVWLPTAFGQFTRVQGGFWIPQVDLTTLPSTLAQFLHFTSFAHYPLWFRLLVPAVFLTLVIMALVLNRQQRKSILLLSTWVLFGPLVVFTLSAMARPIYIDRYFVFAAVAFYPLLAVLLYLKPLNYLYQIRLLLIIGCLVLFGFGIRNVYDQSNHRMRDVGQFVNQRFQSGDELIAGELYVYLDFSYYNHTQHRLKLYAPQGINGYGETSLLYDQPELIIGSYDQLRPASNQVWVVAKAGEKDYIRSIPDHWQLLESYSAKDTTVYHYQIATHQEARVCAQIITKAKNKLTGEIKEFASSCIPDDWEFVQP